MDVISTTTHPTPGGISHPRSHSGWKLFGGKIPESEIVFFVQVILIYVVAITALVNISLGRAPHELWIILLTSSIGYLLPNPSLKKKEAGSYLTVNE